MFREQKGMALVGVIMAVLIFSSLCVAILFMADGENLIAYDEEETLKAFYAAESGIQIILDRMQANPNMTYQEIREVCKSITDLKVEVGDAFIERIVPADMEYNVKLTVSGVSGTATKVLVAYISKPSQSALKPILNGLTVGSSSGWRVSSDKIAADIYSCGPMDLQPGVAVSGNINAMGDIEVASTAKVRGDIFSCGNVTVREDATVTGIVQPFLENIPSIPVFPEPDTDFFIEQGAQQEGHVFENTETPKTFYGSDLKNISGVYYVDGDVIIGSEAEEYSGNAVIVAGGSIYVNGDLMPQNSDSTLALVSFGDFEIENGGSVKGVIIAWGALVGNSNEGEITGIIAANDLNNFIYDFSYSREALTGLEEYLALEGTEAELEVWREEFDIY